jgi:hypothetical protein
VVSQTDKILKARRNAPQNVTFDDAAKVCEEYFGEPRQRATSHVVFKMPWQGDPRINLQKGKDGKAKAYQVRQAVDAIDKLEQEKDGTDQEGDDGNA